MKPFNILKKFIKSSKFVVILCQEKYSIFIYKNSEFLNIERL